MPATSAVAPAALCFPSGTVPTMQTSTRTLKARELNELKGYVSPIIWMLRACLFLVFALAIGMLFAAFNYAPGFAIEFVWWPFPTIVTVAFLFLYSKKWTGGHLKRDAIREDIANACALDRTYLVKHALWFDEVEDEGHTFIVEDEDGDVYCFSGQELPRAFPKRKIVTSEAPKSSISFAVRTSGEKVKPLTATISFHESHLYEDVMRNYRTVIPLNQTFQTILKQTPHR